MEFHCTKIRSLYLVVSWHLYLTYVRNGKLFSTTYPCHSCARHIVAAGIKEVFYDVAELLKAHPQAKANELVIQPFNSDIAAAIHSTDLLQVLLNLTINGLQCTQMKHRVELYARHYSVDAPRPFLAPAPHTNLIRSPEFPDNSELIGISVQDNGPGIPEHVREKIFEPYFTTKPPGQGTGLGLSIVQRLTLQAKGAIHLYSMPGEGTVFSVYFPVPSARG